MKETNRTPDSILAEFGVHVKDPAAMLRDLAEQCERDEIFEACTDIVIVAERLEASIGLLNHEPSGELEYLQDHCATIKEQAMHVMNRHMEELVHTLARAYE